MKRWMLAVLVLQVFCVVVVLLQMSGFWPDSLWATAWLLGLPGSELGQWAAEGLLRTVVSGWPVGLLGASLMVVINLLLAFALGSLVRSLYLKANRFR